MVTGPVEHKNDKTMFQHAVKIKGTNYPWISKRGLLNEAGGILKKHIRCRRVVIITSPSLLSLYQKFLSASFKKAGLKAEYITVQEGEQSKSLQVAVSLYHQLINLKVDRYTPIIGFGGGVIGDLSGFVAGTYLRGVPLVHIPTTLLAQIDSSLGGKTAIDLPPGKNLIGLFYQPSIVLCDPEILNTLPDNEFYSGMAEVIKIAALFSPALLSFIETKKNMIKKRSTAALQHMIKEAAMLKIMVVEKDPFDHNKRELLNFGHTIGHALEAITRYSRWSHGEAVSIGMCVETRIAEKLNLCSKNFTKRLFGLLNQFSLPTTCPKTSFKEMQEIILRDKKTKDGTIRMALPYKAGQGKVCNVPFALIQNVIQKYHSDTCKK